MRGSDWAKSSALMRQSTLLQKTYPLTLERWPRTESTLQSSPPVMRRRSAKPSIQYGEEAEYSCRSPLPRRLVPAERKRALLAPDHTPLKLTPPRGRDGGSDKNCQREED